MYAPIMTLLQDQAPAAAMNSIDFSTDKIRDVAATQSSMKTMESYGGASAKLTTVCALK